MTEQTIEEHYRNRDRELAESFKRLDAIAAAAQIPRFADHYPEAKALREALSKAKEAKTALLKVLKDELAENKLRADKVIEDLFSSSGILKRKREDVESARLRRELGNPPGKKDSLGDQINWEILLRACNDEQDLHLVSRDGDFHGNVVDGVPNQFLLREWRERKSATIFLYRGLAEFAKSHFPQINLPSDAIKTASINKLTNSGNFSTTHEAIAELSVIKNDLNQDDALQIFRSAIDNNQVGWIIGDDDVQEFYKNLYAKFFLNISQEMDQELQDLSSEVFDVPF